MSLFRRGDVWWYEFWFAGQRITTLKTAWNNVREKAKVKGRWHDNRHTLITDLAESGAGDLTIMDIAGHVSKQMLKHCSHIRMEAKRRALESIVTVRSASATAESNQETGQAEGYPQESPHGLQNEGKPTDRKRTTAKTGDVHAANEADLPCSESPTNTQGFDVGYPQKSQQSGISEVHRGVRRGGKSKILIGSSGRTRTYNPSVNSCREANFYPLLRLSLECSEPRVYEGSAAFAVALDSCGLLSRVPGIFPGTICAGAVRHSWMVCSDPHVSRSRCSAGWGANAQKAPVSVRKPSAKP
jgi:hypothetical protein